MHEDWGTMAKIKHQHLQSKQACESKLHRRKMFHKVCSESTSQSKLMAFSDDFKIYLLFLAKRIPGVQI